MNPRYRLIGGVLAMMAALGMPFESAVAAVTFVQKLEAQQDAEHANLKVVLAAGTAPVSCTTIDASNADACVLSALDEESQHCANYAAVFQKKSAALSGWGIALTIASAVFTGVGASTTIAQAKVYSTLGGTTGLGAVTTVVNTSVSGDQTGIASINTTIQKIEGLAKAYTPVAAAAAADVPKAVGAAVTTIAQARVIVGECAATASQSPNNK